MTLLNYINDFGEGVAGTGAESRPHFSILQTTLDKLVLEEAKHKASPPPQVMVWLGLHFDMVNMTVSIPNEKLAEISTLVASGAHKKTANIHELHTILGTILCCSALTPAFPASFCVNRMLDTLRSCHPREWFNCHMTSSNTSAGSKPFCCIPTSCSLYMMNSGILCASM